MQKVSLNEFNNVFDLVSKRWMLLTAGNMERYNMMTISWGTFGVLWFKNVATVFVRPSRYTFEFLNEQEVFSLNILPEGFKDELMMCGTNSGRDIDKMNIDTLKPYLLDDVVAFEESEIIIKCKKLYSQQFNYENIVDEDVKKLYKDENFHVMFQGEINSVYKKS